MAFIVKYLQYLLMRLVWMLVAPFAYLLAFFGVCWLIDLATRLGVIGR